MPQEADRRSGRLTGPLLRGPAGLLIPVPVSKITKVRRAEGAPMFFDTQLFNRTQSEVFQLLSCDPDDTPHAHAFGGEMGRKGEVPPGRRQRVHLFYDLDLTDPLVDIRSPRPEITRLP